MKGTAIQRGHEESENYKYKEIERGRYYFAVEVGGWVSYLFARQHWLGRRVTLNKYTRRMCSIHFRIRICFGKSPLNCNPGRGCGGGGRN